MKRKALAYVTVGILLLVVGALLNRPTASLLGAIPLLLVIFQSRRAHAGNTESSREIDVEQRRFETDPVAVTLKVSTKSRWTQVVEVRDGLPAVAQLESGSNHAVLVLRRGHPRKLPYALSVPVFGLHQVGPLEARLEDPFGFFETHLPSGRMEEVKVEPRPATPDAGDVKSRYPQAFLGHYEVSQPGSGFDFFGLRDYVRSDRMRDVNWKATSRVAKLVVNQHVRESRADVILLLDARATELVGNPIQCPWARTGRVAVEVVGELLRRKDALRIILYDTAVRKVPSTGAGGQFSTLVDTLVTMRPQGDTALDRVVDELLPTIKPKSPIVLFSSLLNDPSAPGAILRLVSQGNPVIVFTPVPDPQDDAPQARLLMTERRILATDIAGLGAVLVPVESAPIRQGGT